ncbi:hypothetical protein QP518_04355 [Peptoniphilus harei]|uniref:hypothetical protein n=1 Tax=Peptoniphilus harei TaxID=54005 RepID=UPI00254E63C8|nr:hypothetical protein [Peptoniphilus harei]MDK7354976.1 hypothetical protein [Peptoniphilus harei]MDK7370622.1 hypothetical protein [Peptoniphilus harei]
MTTYKWGKFENITEYKPGEYIDDIFVNYSKIEKGTQYGNYHPIRFVSRSDRDFYLDKGYKPGTGHSTPMIIMDANNPDAFVMYGSFGYKLYRAKVVYFKGNRIGTVTSDDLDKYPFNNAKDGYYYEYEGIANQEPTISGKDENLGGKTSPFTKSFTVNDSDTGQSLDVKVKLNGVQISSISNATRGQDYTVDIDQKTFDSLDVGKVNTIEISVNDGQGATSVRRWTFTRTNSNPIVKMSNTNLGEQNKTFDINFNAIDPDGDPITSKVFVDDIQVMDLGGINPGYISKKLSKVDFAIIKNGSHKLRVEVTDDKGAKGFGYSDFSKNLTYAWYKLIKEVDSEPAEVIVQNLLEPAGGAEGTIISIKVCNNALDSSPTWEEVPKDLHDQRYNFKNSSKTADKWAVGVWVRIDRGTAKTDTSWFGFVGAYA